jgi:hypothetical protein
MHWAKRLKRVFGIDMEGWHPQGWLATIRDEQGLGSSGALGTCHVAVELPTGYESAARASVQLRQVREGAGCGDGVAVTERDQLAALQAEDERLAALLESHGITWRQPAVPDQTRGV